jgi:hypothetical protein
MRPPPCWLSRSSVPRNQLQRSAGGSPLARHLPLQPPKVASKVWEDFKMTQAHVLGRPRLLGARRQDLPPDHVFGKPSAPKGGEPSAGEVGGTHALLPGGEQGRLMMPSVTDH